MNRDFSAIFKDPFFWKSVRFEEYGEKKVIIQPASDNDLKILPEGDRYNPTVRLFGLIALKNGDLFTHQGFRYRVISNAIWSDYGYFDTLATRYDGSQANDSGGFRVK